MMERICLDMPRVAECNVTECAYNMNKTCHARAITIGGSDRPACDTFFESNRHTNYDGIAGVGACRVDTCVYNESFECQAPNIQVSHGQDQADCMTFRRR